MDRPQCRSGCFAARTRQLDAQERRLALEAAGVAGQRPGAADDAMARHDDRDGIAPDGGADGAARSRPAEPARDVAVAARRAAFELEQLAPDGALERRSVQV